APVQPAQAEPAPAAAQPAPEPARPMPVQPAPPQPAEAPAVQQSEALPSQEDPGQEPPWQEDSWQEAPSGTQPAGSGGHGGFNWQAFCSFLEEGYKGPAPTRRLLDGAFPASFQDGLLKLALPTWAQCSALEREKEDLEEAVSCFLGQRTRVELDLSEEAKNRPSAGQGLPPADRPELQHCFEILRAHVMGIVPKSSIIQEKPKKRRGRPSSS
ncbi:MAG: hypothetical protein IKX75_08805, partial [Desulfovibrio sp.]|nr:hypothetical protein [Desulfovibrio sp.]